MPLSQEVVRSLFAAWRIARFDANAMSYFNLSLEGFWRSFAAALIVLPFFLLISGLQVAYVNEQQAGVPSAQMAAEDMSMFGFLFIEIISFAAIWAAWPLLMIPVSRFFKLDANYVPYIIAANWGAVLQFALVMVAQLLLFSKLLPSQLGSILFIMAYLTALYYTYLIARAGLKCDAMTAIGLVVLSMVVDIGLGVAFSQLH